MSIKDVNKKELAINAAKLLMITKLALSGRYINISEVVTTGEATYAVDPTMYLMREGYVNLSGWRSPFVGDSRCINRPIPNSGMTTGEYCISNVTNALFFEVFKDAAIGGLHYGMLLRSVKWNKDKVLYIQAQLESIVYKV